MSDYETTRTALAFLAAAGLLASGACAHVGQDDFDAGLADLRAELRGEMQEGDERVATRLDGRIDGVEARLDQLDRDIEALEREFGVTVERLETALRFQAPVYFGFDEAELNPDARMVLERFADVATSYYPGATITVEGFTDPAGSAEYNRRLGQRRADAVGGFLVSETPLNGERVRAVSYGEDTRRLVAPDGMGPGMAGWENRRVVMVIEHGGAGPAPRITDASGTS